MYNPDHAGSAGVLKNTGLSETLLVQQDWLDEHAPNVHDVTVGPLTFSGSVPEDL